MIHRIEKNAVIADLPAADLVGVRGSVVEEEG